MIKSKKVLFLLLYAVIISQVGCSSKVDSDGYISSEVDYDVDSNKDKDNSKVYEDKNNSLVIDYGIIYDHVNLFNSYNISYNYPEYLISVEEVDNIYNLLNKDDNCNFRNSYSIDELYDMVWENSFFYWKNNLIYDYCFNAADDINLSDIFKLVLEEHFKSSSNDIDEDICKMKNLSVVYDYSEEDLTLFGWYDVYHNVICLCPNSIRDYVDKVLVRKGINYISEDDYNRFLVRCYYNVLSHEMEHMFHYKCDCYDDETRDITVFSNSKRDDGKYYFSLSEEASAESIFINYNREDNILCFDSNGKRVDFTNYDYVYLNDRSDESLFLLLALFNSDVKIQDYYSAIGNTDIIAFLDFFDMNSAGERYTFYKLLNIVDGLKRRSSLVDKYESDFGVIESDDDYIEFVNNIGSGYRAEVFKIFLSRLVRYCDNNRDFTIDENLLVFKFVKDKIVEANISGNYVWDDNFVSDVMFLEESYVKFLSEFYNVSVDFIRDLEVEVSKYNLMLYDVNFDGNDVAKRLFKRFPMLESIVESTSFPIGYDYFLNENNEYSLKKLEKVK